MEKLSRYLVILLLLGQQTQAEQVGRYFPHHSWERANPSDFVQNLIKEVAAEKERAKKGPSKDLQLV